MPFLRKYGTGTGSDVVIPMVKAGSIDHAVSADWTPATGDVKVSKDGGAAANISTLPAYITSIGWKFVFSDAELQCARLNVQVTDSATKSVEDQHFVVETFGNASAMYAADFDDAVRLGLTALPNAAADAAGGLPISDAGGLDLDGRLDAAVSSRLAAASAPTNFGDLAITATTGLVTVGTNNDKSGYSISGTITTLDALDTAQDSQHSTTQSAISGLNDPTTAAIADAVWLEAIADHSGTSGSTAEALNAAGAAGDPWTTALPGAYGAGSAGYIVGNNLDAAASTLATAAALATVDANVDAILVDTGTTLPATLTTIEGKIDTVDTVADAILVDTGTTLPATLTTIEGKVDTIDGIVDAIVIDTAEIGAAGAGLTAITDAITALNDPTAAAIATAVLTTQMTESYAADGVAPTLAQAVFLIQQGLLVCTVSGTTETIKKLDKSTTAATYSLDDPDAPTSKTRAT